MQTFKVELIKKFSMEKFMLDSFRGIGEEEQAIAIDPIRHLSRKLNSLN